jgi:hypothetical protein
MKKVTMWMKRNKSQFRFNNRGNDIYAILLKSLRDKPLLTTLSLGLKFTRPKNII